MELVPGNTYRIVPKNEFCRLLDTTIAYQVTCHEDLSKKGGRTLISLESLFEIDPTEWEDAEEHLKKLNAFLPKKFKGLK